jgi:hypothetical protein
MLTDLWVGVVERRWNSERPLVFQACVLQRVRGISCFHDVKPITIHQNDGNHLDGGIGAAEDAKWQQLHLRVAACTLPL